MRRSRVALLGLAAAAVALPASLALSSRSAPVARGPAPPCAPARLEPSASLGGGIVTVSPAPETLDSIYRTQISFLGGPGTRVTGVKVVGERSGEHAGHLEYYSQGDGASFVPSAPFDQGERVSVHATVSDGSRSAHVGWHFTTAEVDAVSRSLETPPPPPPPPRASELQRFASRHDLAPPRVSITTDSGAGAPGDLFLAPYAGPGQYGPMILDGSGRLVWFKPVPSGSRAADLRVQEYEGKPVLTWWQSPLIANGRRDAGVVIADDAYRVIKIVRAGNRYQPDLHAFRITPQGTALMTVYDAIRCNLRAHGGPANGAVADTLMQEIDLRTGLVRFEWHSLDHVALSESYMPIKNSGTPTSPWDFFHINSIDPEPNGDLLVDARNTWAAYEVAPTTGRIVWRLGGKRSNFRMGPGATPAWQHDAERLGGGTITFFDNGATPKEHSQSRALVLKIDPESATAELQSSFVHHLPLVAPSQGNLQALPDGNWLVGWGQEPYFSEYSPSGKLLLDGHLPTSYQSFTVLKFPWSARPAQPPAAVVGRTAAGGLLVRASWNGATDVATWRVLGGVSPHSLSALATAPRAGFETAIPLAHAPRYVAAQALDAHGQPLGTSPALAVAGG